MTTPADLSRRGGMNPAPLVPCDQRALAAGHILRDLSGMLSALRELTLIAIDGSDDAAAVLVGATALAEKAGFLADRAVLALHQVATLGDAAEWLISPTSRSALAVLEEPSR